MEWSRIRASARVNFQHEDTQSEKKNAIDFFKAENPDTVVWDGDNYQEDSFTDLLPEIYRNTHPRLVMFLRDAPEEKERVLASWTLG